MVESPHVAVDCFSRHDLVCDFGGRRPPITVLCGSTRFFNAFRTANLRLTLERLSKTITYLEELP